MSMHDETRPYPSQPYEDVADRDQSGRHPINITHLVMGVAFAAMVVIWALLESGTVRGADYSWLLPIPWLAAGAAGLIATVMPRRTASEQ